MNYFVKLCAATALRNNPKKMKHGCNHNVLSNAISNNTQVTERAVDCNIKQHTSHCDELYQSPSLRITIHTH